MFENHNESAKANGYRITLPKLTTRTNFKGTKFYYVDGEPMLYDEMVSYIEEDILHARYAKDRKDALAEMTEAIWVKALVAKECEPLIKKLHSIYIAEVKVRDDAEIIKPVEFTECAYKSAADAKAALDYFVGRVKDNDGWNYTATIYKLGDLLPAKKDVYIDVNGKVTLDELDAQFDAQLSLPDVKATTNKFGTTYYTIDGVAYSEEEAIDLLDEDYCSPYRDKMHAEIDSYVESSRKDYATRDEEPCKVIFTLTHESGLSLTFARLNVRAPHHWVAENVMNYFEKSIDKINGWNCTLERKELESVDESVA